MPTAKFEEYFQIPKDAVLGKDYEEWITAAFEEHRTINSEGYMEARAALTDAFRKDAGDSRKLRL